MGLLEKIKKKTKTGLAVLAAGAMINGMAYAKEINDKGGPLPDETKYYQVGEKIMKGEVTCKHGDRIIGVEIKIGVYADMPERKDISGRKGYAKYSFEDQAFMYVIIESDNDAYTEVILADRDGNGSMETKYTDKKELDEEGIIPEWVIEKTIKS